MNFFKTLAMVGLLGVGMASAQDIMRPKYVSSFSSPDGKYIANYSYFGRIAHDVYVSIVDTNTHLASSNLINTNKTTIHKVLFGTEYLEKNRIFEDFDSSMSGSFSFYRSTNPWINKTDLALIASYKNKSDRKVDRELVVRFDNDSWKVIKIGKPTPQ